ncbi:MAG TPA: fumarylacetoacetate hydrolase family protein [Abditibacterium sp.]|jgi:2-keto-4-pentenoate hydratase/2-oxohepta-3-ene-1,7-dioic acid hydratase in catechol pathway
MKTSPTPTEAAGFRLLTYLSDCGPRAGIAAGDSFVDAAAATGNAAYASVEAILGDWRAAEPSLHHAMGRGEEFLIADSKLLAPLRPGAIYCAGANYRDHVEAAMKATGLPPDPAPHEVGLKPWHFIKPLSTVVGDGATVNVVAAKLDWEAELAVVIGNSARRVSMENALDHAAGYTIANDLSARDLILRPQLTPTSPFRFDWIGQKCFDGSCPLGPFLVPASQIPDPQALSIQLSVNGHIKQQSNTSQMLFSAAEQISHLSSRLTLWPGDIVLTGTPAGTGLESGTFLQPGDVIEIEIERLGCLTTIIGRLDGLT